MNQPIKLIVVDLDGTVVKHDFSIDPAVITALAAARARGVRVTIATGRGPDSTRPYAAQLGVNAPVICTQGAQVVDLATGKVLYRRTLAADVACKLAEFDPAERRVHTVVYVNDMINIRAARYGSEYYVRWFVPQPPQL